MYDNILETPYKSCINAAMTTLSTKFQSITRHQVIKALSWKGADQRPKRLGEKAVSNMALINILKLIFYVIVAQCKNNVFGCGMPSKHLPCKHEILSHCWINVGPPCTTLAQHRTNNGSMSRVFWDDAFWLYTATEMPRSQCNIYLRNSHLVGV